MCRSVCTPVSVALYLCLSLSFSAPRLSASLSLSLSLGPCLCLFLIVHLSFAFPFIFTVNVHGLQSIAPTRIPSIVAGTSRPTTAKPTTTCPTCAPSCVGSALVRTIHFTIRHYLGHARGRYHGGRRPSSDEFSQFNRHSTTQQTKYHEALPLSANVQSHLTSSFADDGDASCYSVCRVPMVE